MRLAKPEILLCVMGGTIDSVLTIEGEVDVSLRSSVRQFLMNAIRPYFNIVERCVALKDSRKITQRDRMRLFRTIKSHRPSNKSARRLALVTHGTFTMPDTAEFLRARQVDIQDWTIVHVGSFWPLNLPQIDHDNKIEGSDAPFNLGFAVAALLYEKPGIYIAMNGRVFPAGSVKKDTKHNLFVPKG